MKKIITVILLFLVIGFANQVLACDCAGPPDVATEYFNADIVFSGIATSFRERLGSDPAYKDAEFVVYDSWKGNADDARILTISTDAFGPACGFEFEEGKEYLVYATIARDGKMYTGSCGRTKLLTSAVNEVDALNQVRYEAENTLVEPSGEFPTTGGVAIYPTELPVEQTVDPIDNTMLIIVISIVGLITVGLIVGTIFYFTRRTKK
ncbi:MAG: hypothetical protein WCW66_03990 [Patescibacteria group bacterium]